MKTPFSRRTFLKGSVASAAAMGLTGLTARSYAQVVGSNEDIRMGVIGFNGRGGSHIDEFGSMKGVRLVALCDADEAVLARGLKKLESQAEKSKPKPTTKPTTGPTARSSAESGETASGSKAATTRPARVVGYTDVRKLLEDKSIDAISTATPNHWHALIGVWGCQAGKDVYVEKPVSHNVWEGRKIVEAARKYDRIVQTGTQSRSMGNLREAFKWVREGNLGKIKVARGLCYKRRGSIGKVSGPQAIPGSVDYDLWCGPAPKAPLMRSKLHYDWHWQWAMGNGDIGNQGIHEMDKSRWALGKDHLAPSVISVGGRFGYVDDGETPNTQFAVHNYGDVLLIFEVRGLEAKPRSGRMDTYKGQDVGQVIECEGGYLAGGNAFDWDDKKIRGFSGGGENHFANFIKAVRSRKVSDLNADILEGHLSSALCHTSNISYRLGQQAEPGEIESAIKSDKAALETFERFQDHLNVNDVCIIIDKATLGMPLKMDPRTERFIDNDKANAMLKDEYRKPFVVPENV